MVHEFWRTSKPWSQKTSMLSEACIAVEAFARKHCFNPVSMSASLMQSSLPKGPGCEDARKPEFEQQAVSEAVTASLASFKHVLAVLVSRQGSWCLLRLLITCG